MLPRCDLGGTLSPRLERGLREVLEGSPLPSPLSPRLEGGLGEVLEEVRVARADAHHEARVADRELQLARAQPVHRACMLLQRQRHAALLEALLQIMDHPVDSTLGLGVGGRVGGWRLRRSRLLRAAAGAVRL